MCKQVYLDLVEGKHIKVTPLGWSIVKLVNCEYCCVRIRVDEDRWGFRKGEVLDRREHDLFCIAGYTSVGLMKAVAPDLSHLERIVR